MPKVSVIVPAYNAMAFIASALDSVLNQTYTDFEVIIIDDGSEDSIREWMDHLNDKRVRLISQKNQGPSAARNTGIRNASGDYIALLDADDIWNETKLAKQVKYLDQYPEVGLVSTKVTTIDESGRPLNKLDIPSKDIISLEDLLTYNCIICGSTPLIRRKCIENIGLFDTNINFCEDWDLWIRIVREYPIRVILEHLVLYRQHSMNASNSDIKIAQGVDQLIDKHAAKIPKSLRPILKVTSSEFWLKSAWASLSKSSYRQALKLSLKALLAHPKVLLSRSFIKLNCLILLKTFINQIKS